MGKKVSRVSRAISLSLSFSGAHHVQRVPRSHLPRDTRRRVGWGGTEEKRKRDDAVARYARLIIPLVPSHMGVSLALVSSCPSEALNLVSLSLGRTKVAPRAYLAPSRFRI